MSIHIKNKDPAIAQDIQRNRLTFREMVFKAFSGMHFSRLKYRSWRTKVGILLVIASIISGFITYAALTKTPPFGNDPNLVITLLNVDLIILLLLVSLIARRIVSVWSGKKRGIAGSHLHVRLVYIFSILVSVPTILMTVFSAFFFHFGIEAWFSQRVQTAIHESQAVAESYLEEHKRVIRADTMAMANDLDRQADILMLDQKMFLKAMDTQSFFRNLSEAIVIDKKGRVLARSSLSFALEYETPPDYMLRQADQGDVILTMGESQDRVRALVKLNNMVNAYLFVGRMVDPKVLLHLNAAKLAIEDYDNLQASYSGMQITVTMIFIVVGLLLLLAAIWSGLLLARQLVNPIGELINAADRVRAGDLTTRIPNAKRLEEFEYLARSFNRMTNQIQSQRDELIDANRQIDSRRRLIETVLAGVSSGVIGVDNQGDINLANQSALNLLSTEQTDITGCYILDIFPELKDVLDKVASNPKKAIQEQIQVLSSNGNQRSFMFNIVIEQLEQDTTGLIITFDDITELQAAQRKAAWSDVARRIAHEIKNPLTPIQLSAERLKRKYLKEITADPDTFEQCTDTIIKHVGDIGRMVDEFSSFARMPNPVLKTGILSKHIEESLILSKQAHGDINFNFIKSDDDIVISFDAQQLRQIVTNLLQNAIDSIHTKHGVSNNNIGEIDILIGQHNQDEVFVAITDNGLGFPKGEDLSKLTEPYVTHKPKGTGLGLAIVKKIMEDHNGDIFLGAPQWLLVTENWHDKGGACVVLTFPKPYITSKDST
ncbi:MAG: two-component sensor histidine kinase [Zetaproteobacteria bacterium]|nr:MAG: two-component sensor histidine kinase [Zetaproteobacteria bacterium]